MRRRQALIGAGGALLTALGACSKNEAVPSQASAAAPAPAKADGSRQAYEVASRGTGFVVGQPMAARTVLVFFDPQCPHCATLWVASKPLHDRIRMVWMPVAFIGPSSGPQGALLLAAQDPVTLMNLHETLLAGGKGGLAVPGPANADLLAKIRANTDLWKSLDAGSVPHMVYRVAADGPYGVQSGGLPTAQLERMLGL
ncbi:MAG: thioredoxin domain-containing protein [Rubrivivax sp.]|nr:thioredoxin domain-containing protein [Rubrivivax sp.]